MVDPEICKYLAEKIENIECMLSMNCRFIKEHCKGSDDERILINHGITGFKKRILEEYSLSRKTSPVERLYSRVQTDRCAGPQCLNSLSA